MRWEIERYVKVYRRDTPEWLSVSWQARGLFTEMLRKSDRDGRIPYGRLEIAHAVAILVRGTREDVAGPLTELLRDGCVTDDVTGRYLVIRNYREAQGEPLSNSERQRKYRESHKPVTESNERNESNAPSRSEPSDPNQKETRLSPAAGVPAGKPTTEGGEAESPAPKPEEPASLLPAIPPPEDEVFDTWDRVCVPAGYAAPKRTPGQRAKVKTRLRSRDWLPAFRDACAFLAASDFHRGEGGGWKADFGWMLKQAARAEELAERFAANPSPNGKRNGRTDPAEQLLRAALAEAERDAAAPEPGVGAAGDDGGTGCSPPLDPPADPLAPDAAPLSAAYRAVLGHRRQPRQLQDADHVDPRLRHG